MAKQEMLHGISFTAITKTSLYTLLDRPEGCHLAEAAAAAIQYAKDHKSERVLLCWIGDDIEISAKSDIETIRREYRQLDADRRNQIKSRDKINLRSESQSLG